MGTIIEKKYEIKLTFSLEDKNLRRICFSWLISVVKCLTVYFTLLI